MSRDNQFTRTRCSVCGTYHAPDGCPASTGARVGMVLEGKYELTRLLGQGGMGEVYEGRHRVIGRRVAVKFLRHEYAGNPEIALRFENEARVAGGTEHENIAGVYDVGVLADGTRYLVMEFLDGEDVDKLVRREAPLPITRSAFIVIQACRALDVVHRRGIVHRDLKPANLFLAKRADKTDLVKVLDFGIAKLRDADGRGGTKTGMAIGTAHYMSPEQARGDRSVDTRSDVYSLGVILYELLSGKRPHEGDSLLQILHKVMTQPAVPLEAVRPGLPDPLYAVVRRAMAPEVAQRFATVAELGDALLPFAGRALPRFDQGPSVFATLADDGGETRPSVASALDVVPTPAGASVVGVARSKPSVSEGAPRSRRARTIVAGGIVGALAVAGALAAVSVSVLRPNPKPAGPAIEPPAERAAAASVAPEPPSPMLAPLPSAATSLPIPPPLPFVSPTVPPTHAETHSPSVGPSGHRTPVSGHLAGSGLAAAPTPTTGPATPPAQPAVTAAPATPPPARPKPTATERGDNPF